MNYLFLPYFPFFLDMVVILGFLAFTVPTQWVRWSLWCGEQAGNPPSRLGLAGPSGGTREPGAAPEAWGTDVFRAGGQPGCGDGPAPWLPYLLLAPALPPAAHRWAPCQLLAPLHCHHGKPVGAQPLYSWPLGGIWSLALFAGRFLNPFQRLGGEAAQSRGKP